MASISSDANGTKRIQFVDGSGNRKAIRLGKVSIRVAEKVKGMVESLNAAKIGNCTPDKETMAWLADLGDELHGKLAAVGLIAPRITARLGDFLDTFIANRASSAKPNTIMNLNQAKQRLIEFFGAERDMRSITLADADAWAAVLAERYAPATAGRTIKRARQFFKLAMRNKIVIENPFTELKASGQANKERQHFIDRQTIANVINAAPDHEWRLIIALSRFGGLRCPSEHLALRWQDIDWERNRFLVRSCKTEHHKDGGERWVPIFPELLPYLNECFDLAEDGAVNVITRYRDTNANLRTTFIKIIKRAGAKPWPKVFQNLRASRQTELAAEYPIHVVCAWIGNSAAIASKHYLTVREDDFERATQGGAQSGALVAQIPAQHTTARSTHPIANLSETQGFCGDMRAEANACGDKQTYVVPPRGVELPPQNPGNIPVSAIDGAQSGALSTVSARFDADLQRIVRAWPNLPEALRVRILAIVGDAISG